MLTLHPHRRIPRRTTGMKPIHKSMVMCLSLFMLLLLLRGKDIEPINEVEPKLEPKWRKRPYDIPVETTYKSSEVITEPIRVEQVPKLQAVSSDWQLIPERHEQDVIKTTPKSNSILDAILDKYKVPNRALHPADYNVDQYDNEAATMVFGLNPASKDPVDLSLLLMARRGHRTRVTHLIGGEHLEPGAHRSKLAKMAKVFSSSASQIDAKDTRDFRTEPVSVNQRCSDPIPCEPGRSGSLDGRVEVITMENIPCRNSNRPFAYCANPQLTSDIPMLYLSYHDFGILKPQPDPHRRSELAAAYISNCGFAKRNTMVKDLVSMTNHQVKSFGRCVNSGDPEPSPSNSYGQQAQKLAVLEMYKFSLSFENSETTDYVTEKFFGALCSGAVPVVIGAPNIKFWAPDTTPYPYESNALIHSADFAHDSKRIAGLLTELNSNNEAYLKLHEWKHKGYTDDFKAVNDIGDVHSSCRICIVTADDLRHERGPNVYDVRELTDHFDVNVHDFSLFIRERGRYAFYRLGFKGRPRMRDLVEATLKHVPMKPKNLWKDNDDLRNMPQRVYAFYAPRPVRAAVLVDEDLAQLPDGCELEVIYV